MCEIENVGGCKNCSKIRFIKPEEDNETFCVPQPEAAMVNGNVRRLLGFSTTHEEQAEKCDHPEEFVAKS